jgi:hypothetical protein
MCACIVVNENLTYLVYSTYQSIIINVIQHTGYKRIASIRCGTAIKYADPETDFCSFINVADPNPEAGVKDPGSGILYFFRRSFVIV